MSKPVPNSYIVMKADSADVDAMVRDIEALIKSEKKESDFRIVGKSSGLGAVLLECDADFVAKLRWLRSVEDVEQNVTVSPGIKRRNPRNGM
jgi:hypothetical protein